LQLRPLAWIAIDRRIGRRQHLDRRRSRVSICLRRDEVSFLVNATHIFLIRKLMDRAPVDDVPPKVRGTMQVRSIATLCPFGMAAIVALKLPLVGLGICCCCSTVYLKPEAPGAESL
jgi:hypothetical protein